MQAVALALSGLLAAPDAVTKLKLPPPPPVEERVIESTPPGARVRETLRFDLFEPWLLGGVAGLYNATVQRKGFGLEARLAFPLRLYGRGRTGFGFFPTAAAATLRALRDNASFGLGIGILEERRDRHTGPSGLALVGEVVVPFDSDGASTGQAISLIFMARGPWVSLGYTRIPDAGGANGTALLKLGLNFTDLFH